MSENKIELGGFGVLKKILLLDLLWFSSIWCMDPNPNSVVGGPAAKRARVAVAVGAMTEPVLRLPEVAILVVDHDHRESVDISSWMARERARAALVDDAPPVACSEHACRWAGCVGAVFVAVEALDSHVKNHVEAKRPFQCKWRDCNYNHNRKDNLHNHLRTHTGFKPYICGHCALSFMTVGALIEHDNISHKGGRFECEGCGKSFASKSGLNVHKKKRHSALVESAVPELPEEFVDVEEVEGGGVLDV